MITIDIRLLTNQRSYLTNIIMSCELTKEEKNALLGIENLLDSISDKLLDSENENVTLDIKLT